MLGGALNFISTLVDVRALTTSQRTGFEQAYEAALSTNTTLNTVSLSARQQMVQPTEFQSVADASGLAERDDVQRQIELARADLNQVARNYQESMERTLAGLRGMEIMGSPQSEREQAFAGLKPWIEGLLKARRNSFDSLLSEIDAARASAKTLLRLSPTEISADEIAFQQARTDCETVVPVVGREWKEAGNLYQLGYFAMSNYLETLANRVNLFR